MLGVESSVVERRAEREVALGSFLCFVFVRVLSAGLSRRLALGLGVGLSCGVQISAVGACDARREDV